MSKNIITDLTEELENAIEEGSDLLQSLELEEKFEELKTETELMIRRHPIASVAIAAAAGYLIGKLFR
ncbi:MAG: hypothetical protein EA360_09810 [Balneolaceae bacterium]|nr:MAG: hypothetical protein EA360_09810 [Balneolaceae bacterium]